MGLRNRHYELSEGSASGGRDLSSMQGIVVFGMMQIAKEIKRAISQSYTVTGIEADNVTVMMFYKKKGYRSKDNIKGKGIIEIEFNPSRTSAPIEVSVSYDSVSGEHTGGTQNFKLSDNFSSAAKEFARWIHE